MYLCILRYCQFSCLKKKDRRHAISDFRGFGTSFIISRVKQSACSSRTLVWWMGGEKETKLARRSPKLFGVRIATQHFSLIILEGIRSDSSNRDLIVTKSRTQAIKIRMQTATIFPSVPPHQPFLKHLQGFLFTAPLTWPNCVNWWSICDGKSKLGIFDILGKITSMDCGYTSFPLSASTENFALWRMWKWSIIIVSVHSAWSQLSVQT